MSTFKLTDWQKVWPLQASHLQEPVDILRSLMTTLGGRGINSSQTAHGTTFYSTASDFLPFGCWPCLNNSGAKRNRFEIAGIEGPLYDPDTDLDRFVDIMGFRAIVPVAPTHYGHWGVWQAPVENGDIGIVKVSGEAIARVEVTNVLHFNAGIVSGDATKLTSGNIAVARMLFKPPSTGLQWMYVTLNNTFPTEEGACP